MTHLHLPDGAVPWWLWVPGVLVAALILLVVSRHHRADGADRLALVGTMGALMLAAMSLPLGPLGYHLGLAPAVGILIGAGFGFVAVVVVNVILALVGHGGFTVIGLNALIMGTAAALGRLAYLWSGQRLGPFWAGFVSALLANLGSLLVFFLVVGLSGLAPNPGAEHAGHVHMAPASGEWTGLGEAWLRLLRFSLLSLPVWTIGGIAEALVIGGIMGFLHRVSPTLLPGKPAIPDGAA